MSNPLDVVIECDSPADVLKAFVRANNHGIPKEHRDLRHAFSDVFFSLHSRYTEEQLHAIIQGKTVGELLRLYGAAPKPQPIDSGEVDGVKWTLHDPPADPAG